MEITAKMVAELRDITGAGMMDCKKALVEAEGNQEKAVEILREKGIAKAAKKQGRIAAEGIVGSYVAGNVGALYEINCESDFVAKGEKFIELAQNVGKTIAANKPLQVYKRRVQSKLTYLQAQKFEPKQGNENLSKYLLTNCY